MDLTAHPSKHHFPADSSLFAGGGQMGELMRAYDWHQHPLGPAQQWPKSLQTGIRMMLLSGYPMFIWWSGDLYMFHNDAFAPTFAGHHQAALGAKAREVWADVWDQLGGIVEGILTQGTAFYAEDMLVVPQRKGFKEETYWTFSYSPMPDDAGKVNGIFCACSDVTEKVLSARRMNTLHALLEGSPSVQSLEQVVPRALAVLEAAKADLPFGALYLLDGSGKTARLKGQTGEQPFPAVLELPVGEAEAGRLGEHAFSDLLTQAIEQQLPQLFLPHVKESPAAQPPDAALPRAVVLPLTSQDERLGFLVAGVSPMLEYNQAYQRFHQVLAGQLAGLVAGALARQREQRQALVLAEERNQFYAFFAQAPVAITVLEGARYVVRLANPAVLEIWARTEAQVLGKPLFEAMPEIRHQGLEQLLEGVRTSGQPYVGQQLPVQIERYGQHEAVYFNFVYHPVRDKEGEVTAIAVVAADVTGLVLSQRRVEANARQLKSLNEELAGANEELRASYEALQTSNEELLGARWALEQLNRELEGRVASRTEQLHLARQQAEAQREAIYRLFMQAPAGIALLEGPDLVYRMANQTYYQILGRDEHILGKPGRVAFPEGIEQGIWDLLDSVYASGKPYVGKEYKAFIDMEGSGKLTEQYYDFVFQPVREETQQVNGILITALNVTHQVEARQTILEREAYFRQMADSVPVMIWVTGADGACTYLNKPWYAYTGQTEPEALGMGWLSATHPEDQGRSEQVFLKALAQQAPFSLLYRLENKDNSYRWFLHKGEPRFDEQGQYEGYVGVAIDVHEQRLAEERLQISVKAGRVGLWEWDVVGNRARYSDLLLELFGLDAQVYQGEFDNAYQVFQSVIYLPDREQVNAEVEGAFARQAREFYVEFRVVRPSGQTIWIAERGEVVYEGQKPVRMNGSCIDITGRKQAEQEVQQLAEKLATLNQELAASNEELRAANEEIQAANEELSQANRQLASINADLDNFVYTASHDLKSPILNIEGLLKALERQLNPQELQRKNVQQLYEYLYGSVARFKSTIRDLTEVARISKESAEDVSSIDLAQVLGEVLEDLGPQLLEAGAQVEHELDCPAVVFSRKNLKSLLYNLLSNAVKYRSPDRTPLVRITCSTEQDYLVLIVQDNGLGFDMRQQDKLFALFKRLHNHVEGTGIGLYIVKKMLDNAGGRIEVESREGVGSTFRVYLGR